MPVQHKYESARRGLIFSIGGGSMAGLIMGLVHWSWFWGLGFLVGGIAVLFVGVAVGQQSAYAALGGPGRYLERDTIESPEWTRRTHLGLLIGSAVLLLACAVSLIF